MTTPIPPSAYYHRAGQYSQAKSPVWSASFYVVVWGWTLDGIFTPSVTQSVNHRFLPANHSSGVSQGPGERPDWTNTDHWGLLTWNPSMPLTLAPTHVTLGSRPALLTQDGTWAFKHEHVPTVTTERVNSVTAVGLTKLSLRIQWNLCLERPLLSWENTRLEGPDIPGRRFKATFHCYWTSVGKDHLPWKTTLKMANGAI